LRVLFLVLAPNTLRNFDSVVRELTHRGHDVTVGFHTTDAAPGTEELLAGLRREAPSIVFETTPQDPSSPWLAFAADVRSNLDLVTYLDPRFSSTYRSRSWKRSANVVRWVASSPLRHSRSVRQSLAWCLRRIEESIPTSPVLRRYLAAHRPDVILFSPYVALRSQQPDYLRAAQALGLRTAVAVFSWDNLSSKSRLSPPPSKVFVWNDTQREEARVLHGMRTEQVEVTGAQCFDEWFELKPRQRKDFFALIGLDPARPMLLYTCFTPFKGTGSEVPFVLRWIAQVRSAADPALRSAGIVIRPHPKRIKDWRGIDLSPFADVVIWPTDGRLPTDTQTKADLFDSVYHSSAVVGLNTSLLIEAGIVGRPVLTVLAAEHRRSQTETLHFRYLCEVGGGLLQTARTLEEHAEQLAVALAGGGHSSESFVREFVRPFGLDCPATPRFVDALERLASAPPPEAMRPSLESNLLRPLLRIPARRSAREAERLRRDKEARFRVEQ
jgi:hypothetical protein